MIDIYSKQYPSFFIIVNGKKCTSYKLRLSFMNCSANHHLRVIVVSKTAENKLGSNPMGYGKKNAEHHAQR